MPCVGALARWRIRGAGLAGSGWLWGCYRVALGWLLGVGSLSLARTFSASGLARIALFRIFALGSRHK